MQVIGLPGRHPDTESWLRSVLIAAELPVDGIAHYRHWDAAVDADLEWEAQRLCQQTPDLLVAKSLGTAVAARAFAHHQFRPKRAVLIGTPYRAFEPGETVLLQRFADDVETLFIQQAEDPGGPASQLATTLQLCRGEVVAVPGSDHLYADTAALAVIVQRWKEWAQ
ncbi:MAG: hypothetical protein R3E97_19870 [Candidatus Eisenbacteria bacterium]